MPGTKKKREERHLLCHCCDKYTWQDSDEGGDGLVELVVWRDTVHNGEKAWQQKQEPAGHLVSAVKEQKEQTEGGAGSYTFSNFPAIQLVLPEPLHFLKVLRF